MAAIGEWNVPGYTEVRALGAGGSGRVVLAVHDETGIKVAIKYLWPRCSGATRCPSPGSGRRRGC